MTEVCIKHPEIYFDLMQYFSTHRTRDDETFSDHFLMALYIGLSRQIGEQRHYACNRRDLDRETTYKLVARNHLRLRRKLFRAMVSRDDPANEGVEKLIYGSHSAPGT